MSVAPSANPQREQRIDETLAAFQPLSPEPLSREDAREILDDLTGLARWLGRQAQLPPAPRPPEQPRARRTRRQE